MTTKEMIEIMQAFEDGKKIEARCGGEWCRITSPFWNWYEWDYRVMPESTSIPLRPLSAIGLIMARKDGTGIAVITEVRNEIYHVGSNSYDWKSLCIEFIRLDGSPLGERVG
jgi:hypothetical protein